MASGQTRTEFSVWELMFVGENLVSLLNAHSRKTISPTRTDQIGMIGRLRMLQADLEELELTESEATLSNKIEYLISQLDYPDRKSSRLGPQAAEVRILARKVLEKLQKEASDRSTFVAHRSRDGKVESMLHDPVSYFGLASEDPFKLSKECRNDFEEAGKCYAIGFTAACIMFILRATEAVIRSYYAEVTGQMVSKRPWGDLTRILKIPVLGCPEPLVNLLDEILKKKRNHAMHPGERSDNEQNVEIAEKVLNECKEAIQMMINDVRNRQLRTK
ncbi:MAG TPA: hypothetical protein PK843_06835 [bacterium]|nr:hypothetical protein [bacterium]